MARRLPLRKTTSLRLLEFGVRWPPEPFIRTRLESLVAAGINVIVVASPTAESSPPAPGIEVLPLLPHGGSTARTLVSAVWHTLALAVSRPRRTLAVIKASRRPTAAGSLLAGRERRTRLVMFAQLARLRPDIVHFEWMTTAVDYVSLVDALGCPAVLSCRSEPDFYGLVPSRRHVLGGLATVFGRMAAVHCVADAVCRQALTAGLDQRKATVIHRGVDLDLHRPPAGPQPRNRFVVLCVGHLRWLKGHEFAVLALRELVAMGIPATLELVGADPAPELGEPSQRQRLLHAAARLGLAGRVRLRGQLPPEGVSARMQGADVLLHPSLSEGLPGAVLEAMACGLPVVASDVGGTSEAVTGGVEGFLVRPRDYREAAHALAQLWRDPELRQRMGQAGRVRVREHFTLEQEAAQWLALYRGLSAHG